MKTLKQFLEQGEPQKEDPKVKQAEKKESMLKRRVLMAKMRAVRQGATGIMASHEPDGELVEGVMKMIKSVTRKKKEKTAEKAMDAGARAKRKLARKVHAKYVSGSEDNVPDDIREEKKKGLDGKACWKGYKLAGTKKKGGKTVDNCVKVDEAKVDAGKSPEQKEKDRNVRKFGVSHNVAGHGKLRRALHRSDRGDKKRRGDKSAYVEMEGTDKAYEYVVSKLKKKYGDGVLTKGDKIKPKTAAQKKAAAAHRAKIDKEHAAEFKKDPSQGRYPPGYSNRGSD